MEVVDRTETFFIASSGPQPMADPSDNKRLGPATAMEPLRFPLSPLQYRRVKSKGAPGLAFETWDPSNQLPLETPTLLFVIWSEAEG